MKSLDKRERRFVSEYLVDLDPKRAALASGYSATMASSKAYQWVSNSKSKPHVFAAVQKAMEHRAARTEITQDMVLRELAKIGFADMRKLLKWTGNRPQMDEGAAEATGEVEISAANFVQLFDSDELDDNIVGAISEISQTKEGALKVKLHDKQAALVNIGKHLGMFKERVEIDGHITTEPIGLSDLLGEIGRAAREGDAGVH